MSGKTAASLELGSEVGSDATLSEVVSETEVVEVEDELVVLSAVVLSDVVGLAVSSGAADVVEVVVLSTIDSGDGIPAWAMLGACDSAGNVVEDELSVLSGIGPGTVGAPVATTRLSGTAMVVSGMVMAAGRFEGPV